MEHSRLPHIIHRQVIDLYLPTNSFDGTIECQIKNLCYEALPEVEQVFALYDEPGELIRINKIYLDLGSFDINTLDEQFLSRFRQSLIETFDKISLTHTEAQGRYKNGNYYEYPIQLLSFKESGGNEPVLHSFHDIKRCSTAEGMRDAFIYYLENGIFPWWIGGEIEQEVPDIFSQVFGQPPQTFIRQLKELWRYSHHALSRLINQFPGFFLERILLLLKQESGEEILSIYETVEDYCAFSIETIGTKKDERHKFIINLLFRLLLTNDPGIGAGICISSLQRGIQQGIFPPDILERLRADASFTPYREQLEKLPEGSSRNYTNPEKSPKEILTVCKNEEETFIEKNIYEETDHSKPDDQFDEPIDRFVYVYHAGLVLLHPFLHEFFFDLGLLDAHQQFTNEAAQTRAVYLLSFLATGRSNPPEHTLPFCKFLCGLPLKTPVIKEIELSSYEMDECAQMLGAVIGHWSSLKSTSPDGLREGFLERKGKLDFRESMTVLLVEPKSQDVLLETLPWGISYIQLPWLNKPFNTTWN